MRTISYKVSYEKLLSRLPAMFAFVEIDEQGTSRIVKATDGAEGDYGKVIADIKSPSFDYTCIDGTKLALSSGSHSYRTLIDIYYKVVSDIKESIKDNWEELKKEYKDANTGMYPTFEYVLEQEKGKYDFITFMDKGIGLKYVGLSEEVTDQEHCGVKIKKEFPLAPDYIYLGEARKYYDKVIKMKKQLDFWNSHTKVCKEDRKYQMALQDEFNAMNGEKLITTLEALIAEAETTAIEYLGYATQAPLLNFNVNLFNTFKDLGMVTPYIQEWVAGKRYYHGDVVYHIDDNGYGMTWECKIDEQAVAEEGENGVKQDELGRKYIEGWYDDETELVFFEDGSEQVTIEDKLPQYWFPQSLNWVEENKTEKGEYKEYWPNDIVRDKDGQDGEVTITGTCNSHLTQFRRYETYMDKSDQVDIPDDYTDWLWYYRKGTIVNQEGKYDEFGNTAVIYGDYDENNEKVYGRGVEAITNNITDNIIGDNIVFDDEKYAINLAMWGDVLTDIKAVNDGDDGGTITFIYWIGAHLKAKKDFGKEGNETYGSWYSIDDDGNYKYYIKDVTIDTDSIYGKNQGVKYEETYRYYNGNTMMEVLRDFIEPQWYAEGDIINLSVYNGISNIETRNPLGSKNKTKCEPNYDNDGKTIISYKVTETFFEQKQYKKGDQITYSEYKKLTYDPEKSKLKGDNYEDVDNVTDEKSSKYGESLNNKKCKPIEETIWTLVDRCEFINSDGSNSGKTYFEKYINGEFDSDYDPFTNGELESEEQTNALYYYKLNDKMVFSTLDNMYTYDIRVGSYSNEVQYIRTNYEAKVDITHMDVETTPLIRYDYYNGVSFQPSVNDDVNIERGVTQAYEKFIKFSECKTCEDLENYANGGFFTMSKEDIDLG